jgi:DNA-binding LytR/AlgR family response regulator
LFKSRSLSTDCADPSFGQLFNHFNGRVRRSAIINVRAVATIERYGKGTHVVNLRNGTKIISSRYYQPALRRLLRPD